MISYLTSHKGSFSDIRRCIRSIEADHEQSGLRYEHLVWVDGPLSKPQELEGYKALEKTSQGKLSFIFSSENKGKSHGINSLIDIADGEIISFVDSDDWILPGRSAETTRYIADFQKPCVGSWYFTGDRRLQRLELVRYPLTSSEIRAYFLFFPYLLFSSLSIRSSILKSKDDLRFNETIRAGLDYEFYSRLIGKVEVSNIPKPLVYYTQNPDGITGTKISRQMQLETHALVVKRILSAYVSDHQSLEDLVEILMLSISREYVPRRHLKYCNIRLLVNNLESALLKNNGTCLIPLQTEAERHIFLREVKRRARETINDI